MLLSNARKNSEGFTLIETLIIVVIVGILSAIAAPSFLGLFGRNKVDNALNQARGALQECQREAIRKSKSYTVTLNTTNKTVTGDCLVTGSRNFNSGVNVQANETSFQFSYRGTITLADAGTVVLSTLDDPNKKKCLVISAPLGIMRTGVYDGSVTSIAAINCSTSQ